MTAEEDPSGRRGLHDAQCMECKICWYVYDPAEGDESAQVSPGTPFLGLPAHWRCPQCDAEPNAFLPVED